MFTPPIVEVLRPCRRILLAGCGGGYDVLGAVPLAIELAQPGRELHFASLSFSYLNGLDGAAQLAEVPNLYRVEAAAATEAKYCPEAWLSAWLGERFGAPAPVWCFDKTGVRPLEAAYRHLVRTLGLDAIVLVDGGIDSLCRGDETSLGTPAEDLISLAAVSRLDVPTRVLACVGLSAELRDGICHAQIFERIAALGREGGALGNVALHRDTAAGRAYAEAVRFVFEHQTRQRQSHVHRMVLASIDDAFGADGPDIWISPLTRQFWFFQLEPVVRTHLFLPRLLETESIWDATLQIEAARHQLEIRDPSRIPL